MEYSATNTLETTKIWKSKKKQKQTLKNKSPTPSKIEEGIIISVEIKEY